MKGDSLVFFGLLLNITDLLCHALKRILVVGILELELCMKNTLDNSSRTINAQRQESKLTLLFPHADLLLRSHFDSWMQCLKLLSSKYWNENAS